MSTYHQIKYFYKKRISNPERTLTFPSRLESGLNLMESCELSSWDPTSSFIWTYAGMCDDWLPPPLLVVDVLVIGELRLCVVVVVQSPVKNIDVKNIEENNRFL